MVDRYSGVLRAEQVAAVEAVPGARFVDLAAEASPRFLGVPEATSSDGFHPSPVGYGFWADALAPAVVDGVAR
jgi:lysophospholipase L1-like esterase